jgi:Uma2 family endonuclease
MSVAVGIRMTLAEFLAWEERQQLRHEFDGLRAVAMTGGTRAHAAIQANLAIAIGGRLRGALCQFFGSDLKIRTGDDHIRYPDGFVACTPGERTSTVVSDPVVVFEVLSPATAAVDRIVKAREYQATASVRRYVMLEQDRIGATVYARVDDRWTHEILVADSTLALPEIGVALPLAELYEGLIFAPEEDVDR